MIFFHSVFDIEAKDYGELIKYSFFNDEDIAMESDELSLEVEEYFSTFTNYEITKMDSIEVWKLSKLLLFGCAIIN